MLIYASLCARELFSYCAAAHLKGNIDHVTKFCQFIERDILGNNGSENVFEGRGIEQ